MKAKRRIFVDMDGVLAVFHPEKSIEEIAEPGYFLSLEAQENVVNAIKILIKKTSATHSICILSSVLNDTAREEKIYWLDKYLPEIISDNRIFVPYGMSKADFIRDYTESISTDDILLDDFTKNLLDWHGVGIKLLNSINNTNKTWKGFVVNGLADSETIATNLIGLALVA